MKHPHFLKSLRKIWDKANTHFKNGNETPETYFTDDEKASLKAIGITEYEVFDYIEDFNNGGLPDFATFCATQHVRYRYVRDKDQSAEATPEWDDALLPEKEAKAKGVSWLPRITHKAKAKLKGILPKSLMFGCGGDRRFLRNCGIHPAEFLEMVWYHEGDDERFYEWVISRKEAHEKALKK